MSNTTSTSLDKNKQEQATLIVAIKYNEHSRKFFIDFSNESGYIVSSVITEPVALGLSKSLNLKIMYG